MQIPYGGVDQGLLRDQADQLAVGDGCSVALGLAADHLDHPVDRRAFEVGQVHRDLGLAVDQQPKPLNVAQPAGAVPDGLADLLGDRNVFGVQIDVVGHQELARPDHGRAGFAQLGGAEVRLAIRVGLDLGL